MQDPPKAPAIYSNCKESNQTPFSTSMFLNTFAFLPEGTRTHRKPSTLATSSSGTSQPRNRRVRCQLLSCDSWALCLCAFARKTVLLGSSCFVGEGNSHCLGPATSSTSSNLPGQHLQVATGGSGCGMGVTACIHFKAAQTQRSSRLGLRFNRLHPSHLWESPQP